MKWASLWVFFNRFAVYKAYTVPSYVISYNIPQNLIHSLNNHDLFGVMHKVFSELDNDIV